MNRSQLEMLGLALALLSACGSSEAPLASAQAAIVAGEAEPAHPEVVAIGMRRNRCAEPFSAFCSGTLIAADVVLTAAHCFDEKRPAGVYEVWLAAHGQRGETARYVDSLALHPNFEASTHRADLALLHLTDPVAEVTPALIHRSDEPEAEDIAVEARVEIVGYGAEPGGNGQPVKQRGTARVSSVEPETFQIVPDPSMTCQGDSGGPAFATQRAGAELVGVSSWGDPACQQFGVQVRPGFYWADFIAPFLAASRGSRHALAAAGDLCTESCTSADQCPPGFECALTLRGSRCAISAPVLGNYREACTRDADCGSGYCGRVQAQPAPEACACLAQCASAPRGPSGESSHSSQTSDSGPGCVWSSPLPTSNASMWLSTLLLYSCARIRSRESRRRQHAG